MWPTLIASYLVLSVAQHLSFVTLIGMASPLATDLPFALFVILSSMLDDYIVHIAAAYTSQYWPTYAASWFFIVAVKKLSVNGWSPPPPNKSFKPAVSSFTHILTILNCRACLPWDIAQCLWAHRCRTPLRHSNIPPPRLLFLTYSYLTNIAVAAYPSLVWNRKLAEFIL